MYQDRIVEEIHRIREEYSRSFNHDLKALFADLQKQQAESGRKNRLMMKNLSVRGQFILSGVLIALIIVLAISVVYNRHMNRKHFSELQKLQKARDEMNIEWSQLQLEESTFATNSEIEKKARDRLGMNQPKANEILMIRQ